MHNLSCNSLGISVTKKQKILSFTHPNAVPDPSVEHQIIHLCVEVQVLHS